jgi:hypothetical protein
MNYTNEKPPKKDIVYLAVILAIIFGTGILLLFSDWWKQ